MNIPNRFKKVLTTPSSDRPVLDASASSIEAIADILMKDELFAALPFGDLVFKSAKAWSSYRGRMFALKLYGFIAEAGALDPDERSSLARKLTADDQGRKAGETLLLVLDKLTDLDKPALLGILLKRFGAGRITSSELRRLATVIDTAFADDLLSFFNETPKELLEECNCEHRELLAAVGLTRAVTGETWGDIGKVSYQVTSLGTLLHELMRVQA